MKLNQIINKRGENQIIRHSLNWLGTEEKLEKLFIILNDTYIKKITLTSFKKVFSFSPIDDNFTPLVWNHSIKKLLYLIRELVEIKLITAGNNSTKNQLNIPQKQISDCFINSKKQSFNKDTLKTTTSRLSSNIDQDIINLINQL